jgi:hypothetical protein
MFSKLIVTAVSVLVLTVGTATAAQTPQGLKADGLRWQAMARFYATPTKTSESGGFNWGDAGVGLAAGLSVAAVGGAVIVFVRRSRRTKLAH